MNIILLIVLHHVGDVWGQPSWLIRNKKYHAFAIYEHCMVWAGVVSAGLWWMGIFEPWKFAFLLIGHFIIDYAKYQVIPDRFFEGASPYWLIYPDQALHYAQIFIVALL